MFDRASISLGFVGWTCYVLTQIIDKHTLISQPSSPHRLLHDSNNGSHFITSEKGIRILFLIIGGIIACLLYGEFYNTYILYGVCILIILIK